MLPGRSRGPGRGGALLEVEERVDVAAREGILRPGVELGRPPRDSRAKRAAHVAGEEAAAEGVPHRERASLFCSEPIPPGPWASVASVDFLAA